jgi:hypothetical protein
MTQSFVRTTEQVQSGPLHGTRQFLRKPAMASVS